jgi:hypothetical protein
VVEHLRAKNGKLNEMPCHHKLEDHLDAYIEAAGLRADRKGPLFRCTVGKTGTPTRLRTPRKSTQPSAPPPPPIAVSPFPPRIFDNRTNGSNRPAIRVPMPIQFHDSNPEPASQTPKNRPTTHHP